ncbi:alcohol oxidase [Lojkania enalia]|uniref:Alcohol oxidase n=1 Tax=Lojkania enalia TaxID=147567 RepID=A0A9P4N0X1_9PLEO|nr:alcohol oxidase [Didymosphaeria enalia]
MSSNTQSFSFIVVGGGLSGVTIASRLSQYFLSSTVALLELGSNRIDDPKVTDTQNMGIIFDPEFTVDYCTTPQKHCNNRRLLNMAGRTLSGSSGVNVGVWLRAPKSDYDLIAKRAGNTRFEFENMLPYFKRIQTYWNKEGDPNYHGFEGPIHTVGGREYPLREHVKKSAEGLGHQFNPDNMTGDPTGLSSLTQCFKETSPSTSTRQHAGKVYDLSKVHVQTDSRVARVLFDDVKRAIGVELASGEKIFARQEVIICCGAQKTPQLLMLSGVGPSDELRKHGIKEIADAPGVGDQLFDHLRLGQYFKLKHPEKGLAFPFQGNMKSEYGQGMPLDWWIYGNIPPSEIEGYLKADNLEGAKDKTHPHLQEKRCHYMSAAFYAPMLANPEYYPDINPLDGEHISTLSINLLPTSFGTVRLRSADPNDEPLVDPRFLSTQTDRFILRRAVRESLRLIETEPLASEIAGETPPADPRYPALTSRSSDEDIDERIAVLSETMAHPMGTCALGSVLDSEFKVRGVQGLRVCDASIFPGIMGTMPSQSIYAFAEMCADLVAGRA